MICRLAAPYVGCQTDIVTCLIEGVRQRTRA
jgi:hypothetical protein